MRVEFIKAWRFYHVGDVIEPKASLRDMLNQGRFIKPAQPGALLKYRGQLLEKPKPAEAALADPLEDIDDETEDVPQIEMTKKRRRRKDREQQDLG